MLRNSGHKVLEAADGSSAINLVRSNPGMIDLILLDLTIPGASSQEVIAEAVQTRPDIKVILTSAYSEQMITGPINAPQVGGFIRKPFQIGELLKTLRRD